jgi:hypothetical protein
VAPTVDSPATCGQIPTIVGHGGRNPNAVAHDVRRPSVVPHSGRVLVSWATEAVSPLYKGATAVVGPSLPLNLRFSTLLSTID